MAIIIAGLKIYGIYKTYTFGEFIKAEQKLGIMDYRTVLEDNTFCNIEIQLQEHDYEIERFFLFKDNKFDLDGFIESFLKG